MKKCIVRLFALLMISITPAIAGSAASTLPQMSSKSSATTTKPVELTVMTTRRELTDEEIAAFREDNPDIRIKVVENFPQLFELGIATGDMPDVFRVDARQIPDLVNKGLLMDITGAMAKSKRIAFDDIHSNANYYLVNGHYYGLPKDWSLDFSLYVYNQAFKEVGVPIPSTTEPMTYAELADLAGKLTKRKGGKVTRSGFFTYSPERAITAILTQRGGRLFSNDFSEILLTNNPMAREVVRYFYDMGLDGRMPITPDSTEDFLSFFDGKLAITQYGYWMGALVTKDKVVHNQVTMLPAPTWDRSLPRLNTSVGPVGFAISANTKHPEAAYRFFEWYVAGKGAEARARTGWGVPALTSMQDLLPQKTPFDRQRLAVLRSELPYSNWKLPQINYPNIIVSFNRSWLVNMELAKAGVINFDQFLSNLQEEVGLAIQDEKRASGRRP